VGMETKTIDRAWESLASGDWMGARHLFEAALDDRPSAQVLDGLGQSLWWLKDVRAAIGVRIRAYAAYKQEGDSAQAARVAVWLSRELRTLFRNDAAASGWLARAQTLVDVVPNTSIPGWVALAQAEASLHPADSIEGCRRALTVSRAHRDGDLEVISLARLGLIEIAAGAVDEGIKHLDESMAAATAGEARDLQCVAEAYCALMDARELLGDSARFQQWTSAAASLRETHGFGPLSDVGSETAHGTLSSFCAACCGGMYLVTGRIDEAEDELIRAISELEANGMESRCVHPATQLAELRTLQGRYEEARALLERYEDLPEAVRPLAVLELALGEPENATARLQRRVCELADLSVGVLPLRSVLIDALVASGELDEAARCVEAIEDVATVTKSRRHEAEALFARGKVLAASGDDGAAAILHDAAKAFSEASMGLMACRARMAFARALLRIDRPVAISEARAALAGFDRLGALPDADAAAAFLRELGVRGRTGPKNLDLLTKRELEVLRLVAQGLSNSEIAERLFISIKTAGHHVSNILSKLGLRSRTEAAAYAGLHLPHDG
jgi:DNA-binding CsgD family transcriptional regulator